MEKISSLLTLKNQKVSIDNKEINNIFPSIETTDQKLTENITIPALIDDLIDDKRYYPKFHKKIREGFLPQLIKLAGIAATKKNPSHWFNKATGKRMWERTLEFLGSLEESARVVARVLQQIDPTEKVRGYVEYACRRLGSRVERLADTAKEVGRSKQRLFCYLAKKEIALL